MRSIAVAALALSACATPPAALVEIQEAVQSRVTYSHYAKRDWRYLKAGDSGNCAAIAFTKWVELGRAGIPAEIKGCILPSGEGHAFVVADGWALDNRHEWPVREAEVCR